MNKKILKKYLDADLIQKTIILADSFGLSIDNWHQAKENSKTPFRIYLYNQSSTIGYLDTNIKDNKDNYKIVLNTPIGDLSGTYKEVYNDGTFHYKIDFKKNSLEIISGIYNINKNSIEDNYSVSAYLKFKNPTGDKYTISFNNCINFGALHLIKNNGLEDLVIEAHNDYIISHNKNINKDKCSNNNSISIKRIENNSKAVATFSFNNSLPYEKDVTLCVTNNCQKNDSVVDLAKISSEIELHDQRVFEFIEEVREILTFESTKGSFSLYDKLTYHSFINSDNNIKEFLID